LDTYVRQQIDEEGYLLNDGLRLTDAEFGRGVLQAMRMDERGVAWTEVEGQKIPVEAFDDPLVVRTVERQGPEILLNFPYAWSEILVLSTLTVDEWDRFHGRTKFGVPYVLSRPAQAGIFELVDEYDDESLTLAGHRHVLPPWFTPNPESVPETFWTQIYQSETAGWEFGHESVVLRDVLPQIKIPRSRILVLGCGSGHDAAFFAKAGHMVTGVDLSSYAIAEAQKNYGEIKDLRFVQGDVFSPPQNWRGQFDIVFEHTCYCAIPPERRTELVRIWRQLLVERGNLLGVFFARDKQKGPPWGGTEWEIRRRLMNHFEFRYWTRWPKSLPKRQGYELVVWAQKKP
jgi:SAM-dependent methyltransferase